MQSIAKRLPNPPMQLTPLRVHKIGAILTSECAQTSFRSIGGDATDGQSVGRKLLTHSLPRIFSMNHLPHASHLPVPSRRYRMTAYSCLHDVPICATLCLHSDKSRQHVWTWASNGMRPKRAQMHGNITLRLRKLSLFLPTRC